MADFEIFQNVPARYVVEFHRNSDVDKDGKSLHHTLGTGSYNASPGHHTHDGRNSKLLFDNVVISGSRSASVGSILNAIIDALVPLGVQNGTSA